MPYVLGASVCFDRVTWYRQVLTRCHFMTETSMGEDVIEPFRTPLGGYPCLLPALCMPLACSHRSRSLCSPCQPSAHCVPFLHSRSFCITFKPSVLPALSLKLDIVPVCVAMCRTTSLRLCVVMWVMCYAARISEASVTSCLRSWIWSRCEGDTWGLVRAVGVNGA